MFSDRTQPKVQKCQSGFLTFIVKPMFVAWGGYVPQIAELCLGHVEGNVAIWAADVCKVCHRARPSQL